jgi:hypothetical protein
LSALTDPLTSISKVVASLFRSGDLDRCARTFNDKRLLKGQDKKLINPSKKNEAHMDINELMAQETTELIQPGQLGAIISKVESIVELRKYVALESTKIVKQSGRKA